MLESGDAADVNVDFAVVARYLFRSRSILYITNLFM